MKKLFSLFLAFTLSVGTMFAWDYERVQIGDLYYNLNATNQTAEVTSQNSSYPYWSTTITTANIPASVTYNSVTYSVISIGNYAFMDCSGLTSVTIGNSVTSIGDRAFASCSGLTSITIPNSVTSIGSQAFLYCTGLTSVTIGNSVTSIGIGAFSGCTGLTSVTIPNSVTSIGASAFYDCSGLTSVTIPNSVTSIGDFAFQFCRGLTSVTIPNSVTSIGYGAFHDCSSLTSVTIGNSVTSIGYNAFEGCSGLTSVTIPNSVTSIGNGAFINCTGLTSVTIGNSVTSIGNDAFSGCTGLTSITIPNSVTSIGEWAFWYCTGLTSVTIPNSVTNIGKLAFFNCGGLTSITCEVATPPTLEDKVFDGVDKSIPLYVPAGSIDLYKSAKQWGDFTNILPISAQETETTSVQAEPTDNSVSVTWPQVSGAASYELVIKDKDGNVVCTLIFNAQGQLTSIAFNAPSRDGAPQHTQTAGFLFTITGLEAGTDYNLTITAKNSNDQVVDKKEVSFHTNWPSAIENLQGEGDQSVKVYHDGQIYILRANHIFDTQGKMIK